MSQVPPTEVDLHLLFGGATVGWPVEGGVRSHALQVGEFGLALQNETGQVVVIGSKEALRLILQRALKRLEGMDG